MLTWRIQTLLIGKSRNIISGCSVRSSSACLRCCFTHQSSLVPGVAQREGLLAHVVSVKQQKQPHPLLVPCCSFSSKDSSSSSTGNVSARPEGEADTTTTTQDSKFALPDKEKEQELSRIQVQVNDQYRSGDYRRALKASLELLKETEKHFGRDHPATASAYNNVGLVHKQLGDFDESRSSYRTALKIYKTTLGADHASYASILHNLGNLNRSQVHFDTSLKATDRLTLIEQAAEYLEKAWKIRVDEMGPDHPHTVASRSSWGSTIATQILHHHKASSSTNTGQRPYISLLSKEVTQQAWDAAEAHLREALQTAIDKPRGPSLQKKAKGKKAKQHKPTEDAAKSIQTLSAASASQNLAIFLKTRATTETPYNEDWLAKSKKLYEDTLSVRTKLLPKGHPDLYATKFSLAELLETMGDQEAANVVRQEIIDTYDPPSEDEKTPDVEQKTASSSKT